MSTVIQMYRPSQYKSWAEAEALGGVHSTVVHSVDEPYSGKGVFVMDDVIEALLNAVRMMDSNEAVLYRIKRDM